MFEAKSSRFCVLIGSVGICVMCVIWELCLCMCERAKKGVCACVVCLYAYGSIANIVEGVVVLQDGVRVSDFAGGMETMHFVPDTESACPRGNSYGHHSFVVEWQLC